MMEQKRKFFKNGCNGGMGSQKWGVIYGGYIGGGKSVKVSLYR